MEEPIFVTDDKAIHKKAKLDSTDIEILKECEAGGGIVIKSVEQLEALASALTETFNHYRRQAKKYMTREQAELIRKLRVEGGYSWRAVARACSGDLIFQRWPKWKPESSQPMGMALCERAAEIFGENYQGEPWN